MEVGTWLMLNAFELIKGRLVQVRVDAGEDLTRRNKIANWCSLAFNSNCRRTRNRGICRQAPVIIRMSTGFIFAQLSSSRPIMLPSNVTMSFTLHEGPVTHGP